MTEPPEYTAEEWHQINAEFKRMKGKRHFKS